MTQFAVTRVTCSLQTRIAAAGGLGRIIRPVFHKQRQEDVTAASARSTQIINVLSFHLLWPTDASGNSMCPADPPPPSLTHTQCMKTSLPASHHHHRAPADCAGLKVHCVFITSYSPARTTELGLLAVSTWVFPWGLTGEGSAASGLRSVVALGRAGEPQGGGSVSE